MMDLDELEALARAATPGSWDFDTAETPIRIAGGEVVGGDALQYGDVYTSAEYETPEGPECLIVAAEIGVANGRFVAAANPAAVLELCALVRKLQAELVEARKLPAVDLSGLSDLLEYYHAEPQNSDEQGDAEEAINRHVRALLSAAQTRPCICAGAENGAICRPGCDVESAAPVAEAPSDINSADQSRATHRHIKSGRLYQLLASGLMEDDLAPCEVYRCMGTRQVWVRPADQFVEKFTPVFAPDQVATVQSSAPAVAAQVDAWLDSVVEPGIEPKTWRQMAQDQSGACLSFSRWGFEAGASTAFNTVSDEAIRNIATRFDVSPDAAQRWKFNDVVPLVRECFKAAIGQRTTTPVPQPGSERNAARYQFLRDEAWKRNPDLYEGGRAALMIGNHGDALDRVIDAAMSASSPAATGEVAK